MGMAAGTLISCGYDTFTKMRGPGGVPEFFHRVDCSLVVIRIVIANLWFQTIHGNVLLDACDNAMHEASRSGPIRRRLEIGHYSHASSGIRGAQIILLPCWSDHLVRGEIGSKFSRILSKGFGNPNRLAYWDHVHISLERDPDYTDMFEDTYWKVRWLQGASGHLLARSWKGSSIWFNFETLSHITGITFMHFLFKIENDIVMDNRKRTTKFPKFYLKWKRTHHLCCLLLHNTKFCPRQIDWFHILERGHSTSYGLIWGATKG